MDFQQAGTASSSGSGASQGNPVVAVAEDPIKVAIHLSALAVEKLGTSHIHMLDLQKNMFEEIKNSKRRIENVEERLDRLESRQNFLQNNPLLDDFEVLFLPDLDISGGSNNPIVLEPEAAGQANATIKPLLKKKDLTVKAGTNRYICPECKRDFASTYVLNHVNFGKKCGRRGGNSN